MTLIAGTKLGRYEIRSKVGEGGMGEVYRARDEKLNRDVAIKVLPASFANDPGRLRRFEQEAQAAGALNHSNILAVYDVGTHDGAPYVVSELLEGESLRERLERGALTPRRATDYAIQFAHGLTAAHERGIIHRDLKPDNLFITKDERVKILDFGLAKLIERFDPNARQTDIETRKFQTSPGTVMGTVGYMSPEQVLGKHVDHRSDIFSFGAVLYEMLRGQRAFRGESAVETLNAILKEEPQEVSETSAKINLALERIVRRCLGKSAERRFQSASDLAFALEALSEPWGSETAAAGVSSPSSRRKSREWLAWIAAGALLVCVLAALPFAVAYFRRAPANASVVRFPVSLPEKVVFESSVDMHNLSVSPDGRLIAFIASSEGQRRLWVRSLDLLSAQVLSGTEGASSLFWSPDSRYIAFFAEGKLKRIEASGGSLQTLCTLPAAKAGIGTWGSEGTILFISHYQTGNDPIYRLPVEGGTPTALSKFTQISIASWISFLPDGRHFLFYGWTEQTQTGGIYAGELDPPNTKLLVKISNLTRVEYVEPGYVLYVREGTLIAHRFDLKNLQLTGEPQTLVERIPYVDTTGWAEFSASGNGVLVYLTNIFMSRLAWFDRTGRELGQVGPLGEYFSLRLSPDGQKVAFGISDPRLGTTDIWAHDLTRNSRSRVAFGPTDDSQPVWSPDGRRLAFYSCCEDNTSTLRIKDLNDTSAVQKPLESGFLGPRDWSPDGRFIIYSSRGADKKFDLWLLPLFGDQKPTIFLQTMFSEKRARFSPDGHWVAFVSDESGTDEVYVKRFEGDGEKWRISTAGGMAPSWRRDGKELFYLSADRQIMAVPITIGTSFEAGRPAALFRVDSILESDYDVTADGQRFIVNTSVAGTQSLPFTVVLNWTASLKR